MVNVCKTHADTHKPHIRTHWSQTVKASKSMTAIRAAARGEWSPVFAESPVSQRDRQRKRENVRETVQKGENEFVCEWKGPRK